MPLPLLFIGVAAATGGLGAGKAIKAGVDASHAKRINRSANEIVETSTAQLNAQRFACGKALRQLGEEKLFVLNHSISAFLDTFSKLRMWISGTPRVWMSSASCILMNRTLLN